MQGVDAPKDQKINSHHIIKHTEPLSNPLTMVQIINPSNAEAIFGQSTTTQTFDKPSKPYHISIHWTALAEYFRMSTYLPQFQSFSIGQISHQQQRKG